MFLAWRLTAYTTLILSIIMTILCLTPAGRSLATSLTYITFISHIALVFGALGVIAGMRAEKEARTDTTTTTDPNTQP